MAEKTEMRQQALATNGMLKRKSDDNSAHVKPKKITPKKKVTASDMHATWLTPAVEKPSEEQETKPAESESKYKGAPHVYTHDEALNKWLVKFDAEGEQPWEEARDYLLRGPPFKGKHDKLYKASIKETGVRWLENPNRVEGDRNIPWGWMVAHDVKELKAVLNLSRKLDGERAWLPCDIGDVSMRFVDELLEMYATHRAKEDDKAREAEDARRKAKEAALGRGSGVLQADLVNDIQAIAEYMKNGGYPEWEYDRELIASSAACSALGPLTPTHAIRVRRGLRFNIITPKQGVPWTVGIRFGHGKA